MKPVVAALAFASVLVALFAIAAVALGSSCFDLFSRVVLGLALAWLTWLSAICLTWVLRRLGVKMRSPVPASSATMLVALAALGVAVSAGWHIDWLFAQHGAPNFIDRDLSTAGIELHDSGRHYCHRRSSPGYVWDYVWEVPVDASQLDRMIAALGLQAYGQKALPSKFFDAPAHWWNPRSTAYGRVFATRDFPTQAGFFGLHRMALWNPAGARLHVWQRYGDDGLL